MTSGVQHHLIAPYGVPIGMVVSDATIGPTGAAFPSTGYIIKFE